MDSFETELLYLPVTNKGETSVFFLFNFNKEICLPINENDVREEL